MQPAFKIPEAMAVHVEQIQRGEYDVAGYHPSRPTILDVGANIGGFAIWAAKRWPGCEVFCYEPVPETFLLLKANIEALKSTGGNGQIHPHNVAIGDPARTKMYLGRNNCGEASFFDLGFQQKATVEVVTRPPTEMPAAQILKLDTEGCEIEILSRLSSIDYDLVVVEYHSESNRRRIDQILQNYTLVSSSARVPDCGIVKYLHPRIIDPFRARRAALINS